MDLDLTLRPARPDDRPAMERICAHTWDWGDYVPEVWDDWLADENGLVLIGELEGQAVAMHKITFHTPHQVWLEGMRVHPDFRHRGIGGMFMTHSLEYARARKARVVRLGTGSRNEAAQTIMSRAGMRLVGRYVLWMADPLPDTSPPSTLEPQHLAQVQAFLKESRVLAHTNHLYNASWAWQELSAKRVTQMLSNGQMVAHWASDGRLAALAIVQIDRDGNVLWIGFSDGIHAEQAGDQPSSLAALATAIRGLAAQVEPQGAGAGKVQIMLADIPWLQDAYRHAGYVPGEWDGELCIFERRLTHQPGDGGAE